MKKVYLVGIDLDNVTATPGSIDRAKSICEGINSYLEISPSGKGLRIFAWSKKLTTNGRSSLGEIYSDKRFLTVTGQSAKLSMRDASDELAALQREWFPNKPSTPASNFNEGIASQSWPETTENISRVEELLERISATTDYDTWRNVIWSIASLNWRCGKDLLVNWSATDLERWSTEQGSVEAKLSLNSIYDSLDARENGITMGTLFYYAGETSFVPGVADSCNITVNKPGIDFKLLDRSDLDKLPPAEWLIHSVLPERGVATIYGPSGSGKSFLAIDLAVAISNGASHWFKLPLKQKPVAFIALEGGAGIKKRIEAWEEYHNSAALKLRYMIQQINILDDHQLLLLKERLTLELQGGVVFIDTLAQATAGFDENSSSDMGKVLSAAQSISKAINGLVILVHHTGKDLRKGARGHSSFNAAMDAALEVNEVDKSRFWKAAKVKDGDSGVKEYFDLKVIDLGLDQYGLTENSCAIERKLPSFEIKPKGKNQALVFEALKETATSKTKISKSDAQKLAKDTLSHISASHRSTRAKDALTGLIEVGIIDFTGGNLSINKNTGSSP